ncbi:hypothetical protein G6F59_013860 [Rhizopus arrhizus]|nr:hypothetical protein G6F59_013860 [Rhizopus arrhizus]
MVAITIGGTHQVIPAQLGQGNLLILGIWTAESAPQPPHPNVPSPPAAPVYTPIPWQSLGPDPTSNAGTSPLGRH